MIQAYRIGAAAQQRLKILKAEFEKNLEEVRLFEEAKFRRRDIELQFLEEKEHVQDVYTCHWGNVAAVQTMLLQLLWPVLECEHNGKKGFLYVTTHR